MTSTTYTQAQKLDPAILPLAGRHLIEASAGTGKTYNITRLYLRLLLEKQLSVQQILVMTFTRAATEELRGRIDKELRHALAHWGELGDADPFFKQMEQQYSLSQAQQRLKPALLELDEAAIFTIHGFCNRVLTQQAFASGMALEISMEADTSVLMMDAVRDWLRLIGQNEEQFALLQQQGWHIPEAFVAKFSSALSSSTPLQAADAQLLQSQYETALQQLATELVQRKQPILAELMAQQTMIFELLVTPHKEAAKRTDEWQQLIDWLNDDTLNLCPKAAVSFINGNRYRKYPELKALFAPFKQLKDEVKKQLDSCNRSLEKRLQCVPVYCLVVEGIKQIRRRFGAAKQQLALMDYNDLITQLALRVQSADAGPLITALRQQYPVALVDEFQDTDPQQYGILDRVYPKADPQLALLMIGDPKQAIYGFRGGDIFTYLAAREGADYQWHMDTNWRSVADVVTGYNRLFWGAPLDKPAQDLFCYNIGYEPIHSSPVAAAAKTPLQDPNTDMAAINYVWLPEVAAPNGKKGEPTTLDLQTGLVAWCVSEIVRLLELATLGEQPLRQQDIAILVRRGSEANMVSQALQKAGLASVYLSNKDNIFTSNEAQELQWVLAGILECEQDRLLTAALSTRLMGGDATKLAAYNDAKQHSWEQARNWAIALRQMWQQRGCMAMLMTLIHDHFQPDPQVHERALTNMIHLAELLQQASRRQKHPQQLVKWFRDQCQLQQALPEAEMRLESDANLIRIVTQHGSKGLEYPVVFIPFASHYRAPAKFGNQYNDYFSFHHQQTGQAINQIGQSDEAITNTTLEGHAESIRLLYVAMTRTAQRCYLGVAPFINSELSPLGLALKMERADAGQTWHSRLAQLVASANGSSALVITDAEQAPISTAVFPTAQEGSDVNIQPAEFTAELDDSWTLSSFSGLVRNVHLSRQDQKERADEVSSGDIKARLPLAATQEESHDNASVIADTPLALRFSLRKGADTGNLLHDILEHCDFSQPQWQWALAAPIQRYGGLADTEQQGLIAWLDACLSAPLPALHQDVSDFALQDLSWAQTLRETEFYFPVQQLSLQALTACLQQHREEIGTEQDNTPVFLPGPQQLSGIMHGFIDLIIEHQGRYYIVDYKSTHLGDTLEHYHWQALRLNNQHHYYDLQYLLYSLALHRYLSVRIDDYDPERHFGGVYYLYLRGMSAEPAALDRPAGADYCGIFHTRITSSLLSALDHAFNATQSETNDGAVKDKEASE